MSFLNYLYSIESFNEIIKSENIRVANTCDDYNFSLIATDFYHGDKSIFVVLPNLYNAQKYYDALSNYVNEEDVLFFPADELISAEMISATGDFLFERIQTIVTLLNSKKKIVVTNMHGCIKYEMSPKSWKENIFTLKKYSEINIKSLCENLVKLGYEATHITTTTKQFSKRGSIVDVFPPGYENPIRLDFFGDEIETIKEFNIETQRSIKEVESVQILPVTELMFDSKEFELAKNKITGFLDQFKLSTIEEQQYSKDLSNLEDHQSLNLLSRYVGFFTEELHTIFDFAESKRVYLIDPIKSLEGYNNLILDLNEYCGRIGGYSLANMKIFRSFDVVFSTANVLIEGLRSLSNIDYNVYAKEVTPYKANQKEILKDFNRLKEKKILVVSITNLERYKKLYDYFLENGEYINKIKNIEDAVIGRVNVIIDKTPAFDLIYDNFILVNESSIFDVKYAPKKAKYKSIYKNAVKISKYDELEIGDYVVHYTHGIGKYLGIKTIKTDELERDFLYVMYANNSGLYIPLEQISNIMKYASKDVEGVTIHEIGGTAWARTKAKVRKRVSDISDKLIALYAAREQAIGFAFPEDCEEQELFESEFEYELTQDQKNAVMAVKRDMESNRPMDRLICGDVGYGKTEVAMRAAFKAVYGGKQVCMLAPTTILARQHYLNFKNRMEPYGIRVELLSRFVPAKKQKEIIEDLALGGVDIVIGTHRVLSNEIEYSALGLLIVDEEQRFGVTHKEKIKELKVNVDCITLSATPIPRTLQMSVMGIKDLSMIETPPKNRYPIQTYVMERNDRIIADAIERELSRGGQIFYLYNFTEDIDRVRDHIASLVPDARIAVGHGKMTKEKLEDVITSFVDKEYDVLLCTTIIETGIDMPDTNTLIIHDADRLGLSQMYQIRGRVGRSNKIAYAYLMYEPRKMLTPQAEKRLETIKEFNELGSGFKIAMRDLSIRGAGDILGEEQSGFVESVGLDMYLKILDEEINKKPAEEVKPKVDASILNPMTNRTIKTSYIDNDDVRISIHKKIDKLTSLKDMDELILELTDRFGNVDEDLKLYMLEKLIKVYCSNLSLYKIDKTNRRYFNFMMTKEASSKADGNKLFNAVGHYKYVTLTFKKGEINILLEIQGRNKIDYFSEIVKYFNEISE